MILSGLTYGIADNVSPSWSPNGRDIVFTSGRGGSPQLYIMGVDGPTRAGSPTKGLTTHRPTVAAGGPYRIRFPGGKGSSGSLRSIPTALTSELSRTDRQRRESHVVAVRQADRGSVRIPAGSRASPASTS